MCERVESGQLLCVKHDILCESLSMIQIKRCRIKVQYPMCMVHRDANGILASGRLLRHSESGVHSIDGDSVVLFFVLFFKLGG